MELKNTIWELHEVCTGLTVNLIKQKKRYQRLKTNLMKWEDKIREVRVKRNGQSLQRIWDYVKRPNLCLIGVRECHEENESKLENILQDIIQENFPNLVR